MDVGVAYLCAAIRLKEKRGAAPPLIFVHFSGDRALLKAARKSKTPGSDAAHLQKDTKNVNILRKVLRHYEATGDLRVIVEDFRREKWDAVWSPGDWKTYRAWTHSVYLKDWRSPSTGEALKQHNFHAERQTGMSDLAVLAAAVKTAREQLHVCGDIGITSGRFEDGLWASEEKRHEHLDDNRGDNALIQSWLDIYAQSLCHAGGIVWHGPLGDETLLKKIPHFGKTSKKSPSHPGQMVLRALLDRLAVPLPGNFDFGKSVSWTQTGLLTAILKHATDLSITKIRRKMSKFLKAAMVKKIFQGRNSWCAGEITRAIKKFLDAEEARAASQLILSVPVRRAALPMASEAPGATTRQAARAA